MGEARPVLLFDLDGICCNLIKKWLAYYNRDYHDRLTPADIKSWDWEELVKPACGRKIYHYLSRPGFFADLEAIPGCLAALERLADQWELCVVTASPKNAMRDKTVWVEKHLPFVPKRNVILTYRKDLTRGHVMFDDAPRNLRHFRGIRVLMDYPYNQDFHEAYRVHDWSEFEELMNGFAATIGKGEAVPWFPGSAAVVNPELTLGVFTTLD